MFFQVKKDVIALSILVLVSLTTGFISVTETPIGMDEPFSIFHAQAPVSKIIAELQTGNNPPLFEVILHYWIGLFGIEPISVRIPSLLFSLLAVIGLYFLIRRVFDAWSALSVAAMLPLCSYFNYISHEARVYGLFWFLVTLSFNLAFLLVRTDKSRPVGLILALSIVNILMLYSHYFAIPIVLFQFAVFAFVFGSASIRLKHLFVVLILQMIGFSPFLRIFVGRISESASQGTWIKPVENLLQMHEAIMWFANENVRACVVFLVIIYVAFLKWTVTEWKSSLLVKPLLTFTVLFLFMITLSLFVPMPFLWHITAWKQFTGIFIALLFVITGVFFFRSYKKRPDEAIWVVMFAVPWISMFAVSFFIPVFIARYVFFVAPFFYAAVFVCVRYLFGKHALGVQNVLVFGMFITVVPNFTHHVRMEKLVSLVEQNQDENTTVLIIPPYFDLNFTYFYNRNIFKDYSRIRQGLQEDNVYCVYNKYEFPKELGEKVVFFDAHGTEFYPENGIRDSLEFEFTPESDIFRSGGITISIFRGCSE